MRVAIVNTFDVSGGAARAAHRLFRALRGAGVEATMVVARRKFEDANVAKLTGSGVSEAIRLVDRLRARLALLPYWRTRPYGAEEFQHDRPLIGRVLEQALPETELINLHWVAEMLDFESLPRLTRTHAPIVWTLHDMLPLTGGCHYDDGCAKYLERCGACPQLGSSSEADLSVDIFGRRRACRSACRRTASSFFSSPKSSTTAARACVFLSNPWPA